MVFSESFDQLGNASDAEGVASEGATIESTVADGQEHPKESLDGPERIAEIREELRNRIRNAFESGNAAMLLGDPSEMRYPKFPNYSDTNPEFIYSNPDIFFDELISLVKSERAQNKEKLTAFLIDLKEGFFSGSPDVTDGLQVDDLMVISARVSRVEEIRGWIGQSMTPSVVYALSYSGYTSAHLIAKIDSLNPGEQIDVVHQLETVYGNAIANGDWADPAAIKVAETIAHFASAENPLMRIVATVGEKRIKKENENPSLSFIQFGGDSNDGRMHSMDATKSLSDKCLSNLPMGYKMLAPAGDVVLGLDVAGMPRYAAETNASELRTMEDIGARSLQAILDTREVGFFNISPRRFIEGIGKASQLLMPGATSSELYARLLNIPVEEADRMIESGENIVPRLHDDWDSIRDRSIELADAAMKKAEADPTIPKLTFQQFEDALASDSVTPFSGLSEDDLLLLAECMRPEIYSQIESELGISIKDMPFRSLVHMLRFLSSEKDDALQSLRDALRAMPDISGKILQAFFAAAEATEFGRTILDICKNRTEMEADLIFSKYAELAEAAERISIDMLHVAEQSKAKGLSRSDIVRSAQRNLLKRARKVMEEFALPPIPSEQSENATAEDMSLRLQSITADNALFGSIIRALRGTGVQIEDIDGSHMETLQGGNISVEQQEEMITAFKINRIESDDPKVLVTESEASFRQALANPSSEFKALFFGNSPVVFLRCEPIGQESTYVGSFNVSPELKGERVAAAFLSSVLAEKNVDSELIGVVWEKRPLGIYLKAGFEKAGRIENWHGTGESFERLVIPKGKIAAMQKSKTG